MGSISLLGVYILILIVTFYGVVLSTQRIPNFLSSIYSLIKYSLFYLVIGAFLLLIYHILSQKATSPFMTFIKANSFYFYFGIFLFLTISISYYLLKEYHKVFSLRSYHNPLHNISALFSNKKGEGKKEHFTKTQKEKFCTTFLPNQDKVKDLFCGRDSSSLSLFCNVGNRIDLDNKLIEMSYWALDNNLNLIYLSCVRHPSEFITLLKKRMSEESSTLTWKNEIGKILIIDAHTKNLGFKEPIYKEETTNLKKDKDLLIITANFSFVGIHSAIAHGYDNILSKGDRKDKQSLLIYDSCFALTDLESEKLYRIFLKHVIPSERLMGDNITIFVEQWLPDEIGKFVEAITDAKI